MISITLNAGKVIQLFLTIFLTFLLLTSCATAEGPEYYIAGLPEDYTVDKGTSWDLYLFDTNDGKDISSASKNNVKSSNTNVGEVFYINPRFIFVAKSPGITNITYRGTTVATVNVNDIQLIIDKVTVIPENKEIIHGKSNLILTAKAWNTTKNCEIPAVFSWDVNGDAVSSPDSKTYVLSPDCPGSYTVNATVNDITGTASVTVKEQTPSLQLTLLSGSTNPAPGQQFTLKVTEITECEIISIEDSAINWTISNDVVQKVGDTKNSVQTFKALNSGSTQITAEVNGLSAVIDISVSLGPEKPQFNIVIENPYSDVDQQVKFTIERTGNSEINTISWKLYEQVGDGKVQIADSNEAAYSLSITKPGTYFIEAEAKNTKTGLTGFVSKEFTVTKKPAGADPGVGDIPNTNIISYQKINPGTGTFTYKTTYNNVEYEVSRATAFGVIHASSLSVGTYGHGPNIEVVSINGKETIPGGNGWMYMVNGVQPGSYPNNYPVSNGDRIIFWYSESPTSTPETSTLKYAFEVDTSLSVPVILPTELPETNTTNTTQVVIPPAEKVIPETKLIENTTGIVVLEKTKIVKEIQVPVEILQGNKNASIKVVEGNTEEVKLPVNVTADDVHLILEVSVVNETGGKLMVDKPGHFIVDVTVPNGKQILVGHLNETSGVWENCPVEQLSNGQWKVTYYSLSPFSILLLDDGAKNPFEIVDVSKEPEVIEPDITNETKPVETPTDVPKSPLASAWLIPGIFALVVGLIRRND